MVLWSEYRPLCHEGNGMEQVLPLANIRVCHGSHDVAYMAPTPCQSEGSKGSHDAAGFDRVLCKQL
jgi:hypothetical protein